ncbi:glutathione S-transferase C-terminal domain-containing protein, partial [Rheinheimera maricola]
HYAEGSAMPPLLMKLVFDRIETAPMPFFVKPVARSIAQKVKGSFILPQIQQHLAFLEAELGKSTWFAGEEFTAADIQLS